MKKTGLLLVSVILLLALGGCSESKEQTTIQKQEKQIETLTHEKKELELLLENEQQKSAISQKMEDSTIEESNDDELESLFDSFLHAEFEQDNEALKKVTTAKLYTILVDKAGEKKNTVSFDSKVKTITIYEAKKVTDEEATLVAKIVVETKVGDFAPSSYQQLVECTAVKNSDGIFQVDSQTLQNLAQ